MSPPTPAEEPITDSPDPNDPAGHASRIVDIVDRPTLRASGPEEIVQLVPYVLGFHPRDSIVLLGLRGRRMVVSVRVDLDAPLDMVKPWCAAARRAGADRVVGVLYQDGTWKPPLPNQGLVDELREMFSKHCLKIVDLIAVSDGRWWSYNCPNAACCPVEGTAIDSTGAIAAAAVAEGMVALDSREALEAELAVDEPGMRKVSRAISELLFTEDPEPDPHEYVLRAEDWAAVRRFVRDARKGIELTPERAAQVLLALQDKSVRDAATGFFNGPPERELTEAWRQLARVAPRAFRAPPATLYALWCYASGSGARANVGIDTALDADPDYQLALIVLDMIVVGMNPFEVMHELSAEARLIGRRIQRKRDPHGRRRSSGAVARGDR